MHDDDEDNDDDDDDDDDDNDDDDDDDDPLEEVPMPVHPAGIMTWAPKTVLFPLLRWLQ